MKSKGLGQLYDKLYKKRPHCPNSGQIELTYRCSLDCVHCYCKGSEDKKRELKTKDWKNILNEIHNEGCINLTFTGGDPFIRDDFLEIYSYAKKKGFLISIFTNGLLLTRDIIKHLQTSPPFSIEITLNGITEDVYESITQRESSFKKITKIIKDLNDTKLPLILKSNCLKQNKHEIGKIKAFTDTLLGRKKNRWRFKYDPMIYPRLNGDTSSCQHRVSFEELSELRKSEPEIWAEYKRGMEREFPDLGRDKDFLYRCSSWMEQFFIDPYGRLKFCHFSERFSADLKMNSLKEGFYKIFPTLLQERFKTNSKCKECHLRALCYTCPARAFLETGDEEAPVEYFCELAKGAEKQKDARAIL